MNHIRLGNSGLKVSRLCLGCMTYGNPAWRPWVLKEDAARPFIRDALEAGINFLDTAEVYSSGESERIVGRAVREFSRREDVVIATKAFFPMSDNPNDRGLSRRHVLASVDVSLERLGTDYIDLFVIHRFDPDTPIEETAEALDSVVRAGKVRYLGASSMHAWPIRNSRCTAGASAKLFEKHYSGHQSTGIREVLRRIVSLAAE